MSSQVPNARDNIRRSRKQENRIANKRDGKVQPGSGNQWHSKSDVMTDSELWEAKTTTKKSFTLHLNDLLKAVKYAVLEDKRMVFAIEFATQNQNFVVISEEDYIELREALDYQEGLQDFNNTFVPKEERGKDVEETYDSLEDDPALADIFSYLDGTVDLYKDGDSNSNKTAS